MATARPRSCDNTWAGVASAAKAAGALYPDLVAAQWALESGWGKHTSGKNNYFGIKGKGTTHATQEFEGGKFVTINAEFEDFNSLYDCVVYLVERWYKNWKQYKGVNTAASKEAGARHLVKEGYATDPIYADKLIKLMREHGTGQAGQSQSESHASKPEVMRIEARRATVLKKEMKQAAELGDKGVLSVAAGKVYGVAEYTEVAANAHARVELASGAGTWYIWGPHWRIVGEPAKAVAGSWANWRDFNALVTPNVSVGEILQWDKRRIPPAGASVRARLVRTAQEFQRIRDAWGRPLGITSWYRPEPTNREVGGVPGSRHVAGEAFDVYPTDRPLEAFYQWIRPRWAGGLGDGRRQGFIHLDTRNGKGFVPGGGVRPYTEWVY
jgi:hypothetical protein